MNILVNGIGNIGTTLLNVLNRYKNDLQIDTIFALKNRFHLEQSRVGNPSKNGN